MIGRCLRCLALLAALGAGELGAQEFVEQASTQDQVPLRLPPISLADTTVVGFRWNPAVLRAFDAVVQVEEEEPGSFVLGAFVGAVATVVILSQRSGGDGDPLHVYGALGAFVGGMIFWSAGIG